MASAGTDTWPPRGGARLDQRGLGLVEILIALLVVAVAGYLLLRYTGATRTTVETLQKERPLASARLTADEATLATVQSQVRAYQAEKGRWPPDRATVLDLLGGPARFQCAGNDLDYDPATAQVRLAITDASRC